MVRTDREPSGVNTKLEVNRRKALTNLGVYLETPGKGILADHQKPVMSDLYRFLSNGETAGNIIRPTGSGKTVIATEIIQALGLNTVVVSPTGEILDKTKATIEKFAPEISVTNFDGRLKDLRGKVINTTLQSLATIADIEPVAEAVELVVVDEVDFGTLGKSRHELWKKFPNALFIGLTATPDFSQLDELKRKGLIDLNERWTGMFTKNIHQMSREEAQEQRALAPLDIHLVTTSSVVGNVHITKGDYNETELDELLNTEARNIQILAMLAGVDRMPSTVRLSAEKRAELQRLHELIKDKRIMVFGLNIKHIEDLAKRARDLGVKAAAVHGKIPREQQGLMIQAHRDGNIPVLFGVDLIGRGMDSPATEVGIFSRPRRTDSAVIQEVGRILRPSEETGKERAIAIQLVDKYEDPATAPVLIPEVVDPEYVLLGRRGIGTGRRTTTGTSAERDATITISGMDIEAVEELMNQAMMRRKIENAGSLSEISDILDDTITAAREGSQDEPILNFYKKIANALPARISGDVQKLALEAVVNADPDETRREEYKKMGQKVFLLLNLKTVFSALQPQFSSNQANNEEVFQTALVQFLGRLDGIHSNQQVSAQVHRIIDSGEPIQYVAEQEGIPATWVRDNKAIGIVTAIDDALVSRAETSYEGLDEREINTLVAELVDATGYDGERLKEIVVYRQDRAIGEVDRIDTDVTSEAVMRDALERQVDDTLEGLSEREAGIIRLRIGLENKRLTYNEIATIYGVTLERIRQIESKLFEELRHPRRADLLRVFWEE